MVEPEEKLDKKHEEGSNNETIRLRSHLNKYTMFLIIIGNQHGINVVVLHPRLSLVPDLVLGFKDNN